MVECGKKDTCKNYGKECSQCWANSSIYDTHPCYTSKDLVEVVRCKDCVYMKDTKISIDKIPLRKCSFFKRACHDNDFCSYGKIKEGTE